MAIKNFANKAAYDAAAKPTIESQVSMIETNREIIVDGVNVLTTEPVPGDAIFLDESNKIVFVKGGSWIQKAIIPSAWTWVGTVFFREGRQVAIVHKTGADRKYADVLQYSITAITSTTPTINLRIQDTSKSGDAQYATNIPVTPTLTSTNIDATTAAEISAAVAAKATEKGDSAAWWAYLADADDNPVSENGTKIIIQCDVWKNYQQNACSMTGGTIAFTTWGDMPASTVYWKVNGAYSEYRGLMNLARGLAYWSTNGRTPSANVTLPESGNTDPLKRTAFETSQYCAAVREKYTTYEDYLRGEFMVMCPQKYGSFALPDGKTLANKYALKTAPTKAGGTKYKFPAMNYAYTKTFGVDKLDYGCWFLPGILEGCRLMNDKTLAIISPTISKMAGTAINNSTTRWFAQRYYANYARLFNGGNGTLNYNYVYNSFRAQAVALLEID